MALRILWKAAAAASVFLTGACATPLQAAPRQTLQDPATSAPATSALAVSPDLSAALDAYMKAAVQNAAFSGTVLVAAHGRPVFRGSYGLANRAFDVPNDTDTVYQLASVTKPFTALLIMMLQEEGRLSVDDLACDHLADCPPAWRAVTVRQLLTHTSGIPNYTSLPDWDEALDSRTYGPGGVVALVRDRPLEFAPGQGYRYSNTGYNLLGTIIERVAGKPYPEVLRERILAPLHMDHTVFNASRRIIPHLATGYYSIGSTFIEATPQSMTGVYGEAGLSSTVDDLSTWAQAVGAGRLVSPASLAQMTDGARNNYGFGWEIRSWHGRRMVGHAGSGPGFSNMVARFPDDDLTIVVLSNSDEASGGGTARALAGLYFGEATSLPDVQPKTVILDAVMAGGAEAGIRQYQAMKAAQPSAEAFATDELLVEIGYELSGLPAMEEARRLFAFTLEQFPQSAFSHDGLADLSAAEGDFAAAIAHFETSLRLDPDNEYAREGLKRLKGLPES